MVRDPKTALIVVDLQNDFITGTLAVPEAEGIVENIRNLLKLKHYDYNFATMDWHPELHESFASRWGDKPFTEFDGKMLWPDHCVAKSWGAELHPLIDNDEFFDGIIYKGTFTSIDNYSGFTNGCESSGLIETLRTLNVNEVDICGLATDYCVYETAKDALNEGLKVNILDDLCKAVDFKEGQGKLLKLSKLGAQFPF